MVPSPSLIKRRSLNLRRKKRMGDQLKSSCRILQRRRSRKSVQQKKKAKASAKSSENRPSKKVKKAEETEFVFELSKMRKCTVGTFKGMVLVNIREYYIDKNSGEEKPGYKGLALQANQWASLMTRVSDIDAAAQSSEEVKFDLGGKKKCSVREFKGKTLVDLREYYEDKNTGEEKPGKKGISLSTEQWLALKDAADDIDEAVKMFS
mmetsp:Transcript_3080/g.5663  ORF Transcript_3080/g.5663 Transcript_3080/m.5663 type:complete len:207 (-) Transcript_3080:330-950(-)